MVNYNYLIKEEICYEIGLFVQLWSPDRFGYFRSAWSRIWQQAVIQKGLFPAGSPGKPCQGRVLRDAGCNIFKNIFLNVGLKE